MSTHGIHHKAAEIRRLPFSDAGKMGEQTKKSSEFHRNDTGEHCAYGPTSNSAKSSASGAYAEGWVQGGRELLSGRGIFVIVLIGWLTLTAEAAPKPRTAPPVSTSQIEKSLADIAHSQREALKPDPNARESTVAAAKSANWTMVAALASFGALLVSGLALLGLYVTWRETKRTADAAVAAVEADIKPYLIIRPCSRKIEFKDGRLLPDPIEFAIENAGRSPAIVTGIYREWWMCDFSKFPDSIPYGTTRDKWVFKETAIPVGPSTQSSSIESFSTHLDGSNSDPRSWISFMGYIEYEDMARKRYVSGFLYVFRLDMPQRGLHLALPDENPERYNYHLTIEQLQGEVDRLT